MTKNTLGDLNNHLFAQLERLMDDDLSDEDLEKEIRRSKAVTVVADTAIRNATLALDAMKHLNEYRQDGQLAPIPRMLEVGGGKNGE